MTDEEMRKILKKMLREIDRFIKMQTRIPLSTMANIIGVRNHVVDALKQLDDDGKAKT